MTTVDEAKNMARRLRSAMEARGIGATHADALELVAAQLGHRDWNTASTSFGPGDRHAPQFTLPIPVLRSLDEKAGRTFYCDFLGFEVDFEHRFEPQMPLYLGLKRGPVRLHLTEHPGDATTGSSVFVWMTGIEHYRRELMEQATGYAVPDIFDQPWGREIAMLDPFRNRLRFCEAHT